MIMKTQNSFKRMIAIAFALFAMLSYASADWTTYDASTLPGDAGFNVKNGAGADATLLLVDDADNAGNKILRFISGSADKNTLEAPKFDSKVSGGGLKQAFTVVMRVKAYKFSEDSVYKNFMEVEVKDGELRDKARFYPETGVDIEKANSKELKAYPAGHNSYDFNIYRVTFKEGITKIWINDVLVDESVAASTTTSDSDSRFVIGDSNSSADYGIEYDWIIWDNSDAYAPGEGADYPAGFVISPLSDGGEEVGNGDWTIYSADETFAAYGFSEGSSSDFGGDVNVIDDVDNAGNKLVELVGPASLKNYWKYKLTDSTAIADDGVTIVTRMKAENDSTNMAAIQITTGAFYAKIYVQKDGKLKVDGDATYTTGLDFTKFHIFRLTMTGSTLDVWVDDVKYCNAYTVTSTSSNDPSFRIGDASTSDAYISVIDWIIWDETAAYGPGEGSDYPSSLVIDPLSGGEVVIPDFFYFDEGSMAVAQEGETIDADLEANASWTLECDDSWITSITPLAGDSGVATVSITAEANTGAAPRTATIYGMIGEDEMDQLIITQDGLAVEVPAISATASSSQVKDGVDIGPELTIDKDNSTVWVPTGSIVNGASEWVKVAVASGSEVVMVKITEYKNSQRLTCFSVDYWNGSEYVEVLAQQLSEAQVADTTVMAFALPSAIITDTLKFNFYGNTNLGVTDPSTASGWLSISELSVWGAAATSAIGNVNAMSYKVFPNPAMGSFTIENASGANIRLVSLTGQVVFEKSNISVSEKLDLNLNSGIYLLNVDDSVSKIIVR